MSLLDDAVLLVSMSSDDFGLNDAFKNYKMSRVCSERTIVMTRFSFGAMIQTEIQI